MRRLIIVIALLAVAGAGAGAAALASGGGPKITESVIGAASINRTYNFHITRPGDAVFAKAVVPPGASFGWHYHRASVVAMVQSGTLTLYDGLDRRCTPQRFSAGQGFIEHEGHIHLARNEGT